MQPAVHILAQMQDNVCAAQIIVATGFIAKTPTGQVTTLKRNGSDYSATILGALFQSSRITIWTDVDGVFSADPRKVGLGLSDFSLCRPASLFLSPASLLFHRCAYPTGCQQGAFS